ncbi:MAG: hypothetical protein B7Z10_08115 [Rhodobacterales bacterium 32-66-7]|nr:MAG: hypothetical protein B7Z10_08115 [Rhodobacterales bacterium 32-66-7]
MAFDFVPDAIIRGRSDRGRSNFHAGKAAEDAVALHYERQGVTICARRWRGHCGEIDLVGRLGGNVIVIEVKQSQTHDLAASHVLPGQIGRIFATAEEFLAGEPMGTDLRIDLALVDGQGRIDVLENAFA